MCAHVQMFSCFLCHDVSAPFLSDSYILFDEDKTRFFPIAYCHPCKGKNATSLGLEVCVLSDPSIPNSPDEEISNRTNAIVCK